MSQHDFNIANATFPNTRTDLNNAFAALASTSKGSSAPGTLYTGQLWIDDSAGATGWILKMYDGTDHIPVCTIDSTNNYTLSFGRPVNSQSAAYTTVLNDQSKTILHPTADNNPRTFTIDSNANVPYPLGAKLHFVNQINTLTIAITSDTLTLEPDGTAGSITITAGQEATATKISTTGWVITRVTTTFPSLIVSGLVDLSGAAAGQVKFPATQNASADANTLDDYEEGTWTPIITASTTPGTHTYGTQSGTYTKIGREVTAYFSIILTALDAAIDGAIRLGTLPYTCAATSYGAGVLRFLANATYPANSTHMLIAVNASATTCDLYLERTTGGLANVAEADLSSTLNIQGFIKFFV